MNIYAEAKIIGLFVAISFLIVYCAVGSINYMRLPGELIKIEQLRKDAQYIKTGNNEDVIGLIVQCNQIIKSQQIYNKKWWSSLAIPDAWDAVKVIDIPQ